MKADDVKASRIVAVSEKTSDRLDSFFRLLVLKVADKDEVVC